MRMLRNLNGDHPEYFKSELAVGVHKAKVVGGDICAFVRLSDGRQVCYNLGKPEQREALREVLLELFGLEQIEEAQALFPEVFEDISDLIFSTEVR